MANHDKTLAERYSKFAALAGQSFDKKDSETLHQAWEFAELAHSGQKRLSGEPYVLHGLATASTLLEWKLDVSTIVAGLLHDSIEDGGATREDLEKEFGNQVAMLVDGVTKVSHLHLRDSEKEQFVENLRKMFLAMAKDLRVVFVKLADRLHNMQTLSVLPPKKQKRIARETIEVYAPLAERLGMGEIKSQLDDLAFPYVHPGEYKKVVELSKTYYQKSEVSIKKMRRTIIKRLTSEGVKSPQVDGRKKHLFSLYRKLERIGIDWDFEKINDIVALRILVNNVGDCYVSLGVVHDLYKPVPSLGVSDFIAQPKPNGYRSIHTKVFGPNSRIVEVQIRTHEMHDQAEHGLAAHWVYAQQKQEKGVHHEVLKKVGAVISKDKLAWVKQLAKWQEEITDSQEFLKAVKFDALNDRIFVFSPKGDVFDLPVGATPVDFAFAVHTALGRFIKDARVNRKMVPLSHKLQSGDVVEIIKTKAERRPNENWLDSVVTTEARREITKYLRK